MSESPPKSKQMPVCWAATTGGCGQTISREHVVSKSLFDSPGVTVHGFHWCKNEPISVGIESLTAKILCREHNSALSPLDSAAGSAFDAFRQNAKRNGEVHKRSILTMMKEEPFIIDAKFLERWLLKTLLNLTFQREYFIGASGTEKGIPPRDLVEICYGRQPFPGDAGMYVAANTGMMIRTDETLTFCPLIRNDERVLGAFFTFQGIRIVLLLMPEGLRYPLSTIPTLDKEWSSANLLRRFEEIRIQYTQYLSQAVIKFAW